MRFGLRIVVALIAAAAVSLLPVFEIMLLRWDCGVISSGSFWETRAATAEGAETDLVRDLGILAAAFAIVFEISGWRRMAHSARLFFSPTVLWCALAFAIASRGAPGAGVLLLITAVIGLVRRLLYLPSANRSARSNLAD